MELAELNAETYWYSRFPNTLGWIYSEIGDFASALRLNTEGVRAGIEAGTPEAEANAHINLANTCLLLSERSRAGEHLRHGEAILNRDGHKHWLRWRFRIRLELTQASHRIAAGDLAQARVAAESALGRANGAKARKHAADAHRILGNIAAAEEHAEEASAHYDAGLAILRKHPCSLMEVKLLRAAGGFARMFGRDGSEVLLVRAERSAAALADSLRDGRARELIARSDRMAANTSARKRTASLG